MKKLFKIFKLILLFFSNNVYLIMILTAIYAVIMRDYLIMIDIAVLALICIAIELRDRKDSNKIENAIELLKAIIDHDNKKAKKCDLYSDTSKCPDNTTCDKCKYFN